MQVSFEEDTASLKPAHLPRLIPNGTLRLSPPIVLHNLLPYSVHYSMEVTYAVLQFCVHFTNPLVSTALLFLFLFLVNASPSIGTVSKSDSRLTGGKMIFLTL